MVRRPCCSASRAEPWASVDWDADEDWDWHSAADDTPEQLWRAVGRRGPPLRRGGPGDAEASTRVAARPRHGSDEPISLRWILVHMIEEYARHNGHADLIRQSIDGQVGCSDDPRR